MKIAFVALFFILFLSLQSHAQNQKVLDSLMHVYNTTKHDTTKILALTSIAQEYRSSKPDTCISIAEKALQMSEKIGFENGKGWAWNRMGLGNFIKGKYPEALAQYQKTLPIFEKIREKKGIANSLYNIGLIYYNQGNYPLALEYYQKSMKIREEIGYKQGISYNLTSIGLIYYNQGNYPLALEYYQKSMKIQEELNDKKGMSYSLNNLGDFFTQQGEWVKATEYYQKSLILERGINDMWGTIYTLKGLAQVYQKQKDYDKAIAYSQEGLKIAQETKALAEIKILSESLYQTCKLKGDYAQALTYFELAKQTNDSLFNIEKANSISNLESRYLLDKKEKELELNKLNTEKQARELEITKKQAEADQLFALARAEKDKRKQDSLYNLAQQSQLEAKNLKTQEEKNRLEQDKKALAYEAEVADQKNIRNTFLVLSSALIFIVALVVFSLRQKQKSNQLLAAQKVEIEEKNKNLQYANYEIKTKNEALLTSEEELRQNMEELETSQELLREQKQTIEIAFQQLHKQNTKVNDSIRYAQRIQNAILPHENILASAFAEHFVIFKPKDVVSGDFYWYLEVEGKKFLAVVDCTGHGVPGAFMSMIGNTLLSEIITTKHIYEPHLVLEQLHLGILNSLNQKDNQMQDGMDIALCCIENKEEQKIKVLFSGAKRPLYYFSNQLLNELSADKKSIGQAKSDGKYSLQEISLKNGDALYMTTDGWIDSTNPERERFGSPRFKEMLLRGANLPLYAQKEVFTTILEDYEQGAEQRDDVLMVGVKV